MLIILLHIMLKLRFKYFSWNSTNDQLLRTQVSILFPNMGMGYSKWHRLCSFMTSVTSMCDKDDPQWRCSKNDFKRTIKWLFLFTKPLGDISDYIYVEIFFVY